MTLSWHPRTKAAALGAAALDWIVAVLLSPPTVDGLALDLSAGDDLLFDVLAEKLDCQDAVSELRRALGDEPLEAKAVELSVAWTKLFGGARPADTV